MLPPRNGENPFGAPPATWWLAGFAAGWVYHLWFTADVVVGGAGTVALVAYVYIRSMPRGGAEGAWLREQREHRERKAERGSHDQIPATRDASDGPVGS